MLKLLNKIFTPSAPISNPLNFSGRYQQLEKISSFLNEKGQHAVIYGARGMGKTSLANVLQDIFPNHTFLKTTCNRIDDYSSIWKKVLRKINIEGELKSTGFKPEVQKIVQPLLLNDSTVADITLVEEILSGFPEKMVFVFDEFDSISSETTKAAMADTIKLFSDNFPNLKIIILGVAENVHQLLGHHPSVERCLLLINMGEMRKAEMEEIIQKGMGYLKLEMDDDFRNQIIMLSSGFPHYVHQLCYYCAESALLRKSGDINARDLEISIGKCVSNADFTLHMQLTNALGKTPEKNQFARLILACVVCAESSTLFSLQQIKEQLVQFYGQDALKTRVDVIVGMLCNSQRGYFLKAVKTPEGKMYKLSQPLMRPYVKLQMHSQLNMS